MPPRVNLESLKMLEAIIVAWVAERKKKRPAADVGQYELRRLRKGLQLEEGSTQVEVETTLVAKGRILTGIPLGGSSAGTV